MTRLRALGPADLLLGLLVAADAAVVGWIAVRAYRNGWRLVGDNASVVLRASDVASTHPPLTGMPSGFMAWSTAANPSHPGPAGLWPLAPTGVFGRSEPVVLTITWAVAVASIVLAATVARRVAGPWVASGAVLATIAFQASLANAPMWVPLTPVLVAQPMLAACFLTWGIVAHQLRWWPWWALVSGVVVQANLAYAPLLLGLGLLAVAGSTRDVLHARRAGADPVLTRRTVAGTVAAAVAVWFVPVLEALTNGGGNVRELLRAAGADVPVAGFARARDAFGTGLVGPRFPNDNLPAPSIVVLVVAVAAAAALASLLGPRVRDGATRSQVVRRALIVAAIVVATVVAVFALSQSNRSVVVLTAIVVVPLALWRPRPARRPAAAVGLVALLAAAASQGLTPAAAGIKGLYELPISVAAAFVAFAIGLMAWDALAARRAVRRQGPPNLVPRFVGFGIVGVVLLSALGAAGRDARDIYLQDEAASLHDVARQTDEAVPDGTYRWEPLGGPDATALAHGLALDLLDRGIELRVEPSLGGYYGSHRVARHEHGGTLVLTIGDGAAPVADAQLVARARGRGGATPEDARQTADWVRTARPAFEPWVKSFNVGTIMAGLGADADWRRSTELPDDLDHLDLGDEVLDDQSKVADLPQGVLVELAVQGLVDRADAPPEVAEAIDRLGESRTISIWSVPG